MSRHGMKGIPAIRALTAAPRATADRFDILRSSSANGIEIRVARTPETNGQGGQFRRTKGSAVEIVQGIELETLPRQKIEQLLRRRMRAAKTHGPEFETKGDMRGGGEHTSHPAKRLNFPALHIDLHQVGSKRGQKLVKADHIDLHFAPGTDAAISQKVIS
jgi:hypothetical protein